MPSCFGIPSLPRCFGHTSFHDPSDRATRVRRVLPQGLRLPAAAQVFANHVTWAELCGKRVVHVPKNDVSSVLGGGGEGESALGGELQSWLVGFWSVWWD